MKKKWPRTHIWLLVVCLLFLESAVTVGVIAVLTGDDLPAMLGAAAMQLGFAALFYFLWRRHKWVDLTLLARRPEKALARLEKVCGDRALGEIAEKSEGVVRETALGRMEVPPNLEKEPVPEQETAPPPGVPAVQDAAAALTDEILRLCADAPEKAAALCRDASLPLEARLAAVKQIDDPGLLRALYDPAGAAEFRCAVLCAVREEAVLVELIELEPDKALRVAAEKRVTDPELRRAYCARDAAHEYVYLRTETESTMGTSHIYHDEYTVYRCRYCGHEYREESGSWHD